MSVRKRAWITRLGEARESWIVDYSDQHGDRHIQTFDRKSDAAAFHDEVRLDVRKGVHTAPSKSPTVTEAADAWLSKVRANGAERSTLAQYEQHVRIHIVPRLGPTKLAQLSPKTVEIFRDQLLADLERPTARKVLTSFKSMLKVAKMGHIAADVAIAPDKRGKRKLEVGTDIPTPKEIARIIEAADGLKIKTLLLLASLTGLRASELRGLRWKDVDFAHGELHVRQRADCYLQIGALKSASSQRVIPLPQATLAPTLKAWKLRCPKSAAGLVFPAADGDPEHHETVYRAIKPVLVKAGVVDSKGEPKYALHDFRHFFASWCINPKDRGGRGLPAKVVQELMGHSGIQMTLDTYGHLFPSGDDRSELHKAEIALLGRNATYGQFL